MYSNFSSSPLTRSFSRFDSGSAAPPLLLLLPPSHRVLMRMLLFGFRHPVCLVAEPTLFAFVGGAAVQRDLIIVAVYFWQLGEKKNVLTGRGGGCGGCRKGQLSPPAKVKESRLKWEPPSFRPRSGLEVRGSGDAPAAFDFDSWKAFCFGF